MEVQKLFWLDMEMTGLDPYTDTILEVAALLTDIDLKVIDEGINLVVHHPAEILQAMDEWNRKTHKRTGLTKRVIDSDWMMSEVEEHILRYVQGQFAEKTVPVCGNSVWQDRMFLMRHMPKLNGYMHYRNIDVSAVKELSFRWFPNLPAFQKKQQHSALADILESIEELKYYRKNCFQLPNKAG